MTRPPKSPSTTEGTPRDGAAGDARDPRRGQGGVSDDAGLTPAAVKDYLRRHPEILADDLDLLARVMPVPFAGEARVVDMQAYLVESLKNRLGEAETERAQLLDAAQFNQTARLRIHNAVLQIVQAQGFEDLLDTVTKDLPKTLGLEMVALCLESRPGAEVDPLPSASFAGVHVLSPNGIDGILGAGVSHLLRSDITGNPIVYGTDAERVRSEALVRLYISKATPPGLLAFGATDPDTFDPSMGVDLLDFLARILESMVRAWLDLPPPH